MYTKEVQVRGFGNLVAGEGRLLAEKQKILEQRRGERNGRSGALHRGDGKKKGEKLICEMRGGHGILELHCRWLTVRLMGIKWG